MNMPPSYITETLILIALGASIALPLILLNIRLAPRLGLIDWPKARGVTDDHIPIVGHSMVLLSLAALGLVVQRYSLSPWFLTTSIGMAIMGHFDDRKPLPALDKMFFQSVCVIVVVYLDPQIRLAMTAKYGVAGTFWACFFILGLMNAVNFIDGIDGLAGLVLMVGAAGYILLARGFEENYPYGLYAALLMGMLIPFLYVNIVKRRGFLGNVGSYFFSYVLGMMHMSIPLEAAGPLSRLSLSSLCFLIPVADAVMVLIVRLSSGRSPFQADKGHLHHRLVQTSIKLRYILLNFGLIETAALGAAFVMADNPGVRASGLPLYICATYITITALLILLVEKASRRRTQAYFQRLDTGEPIYFMKYEFRGTDGAAISSATLRRLEARVSAEIRVTDLCFAEAPHTLFVTLKTLPEPLKGISSRLDSIFQSEHVQSTVVIDQGEFVKVSHSTKTLPRKVAGY